LLFHRPQLSNENHFHQLQDAQAGLAATPRKKHGAGCLESHSGRGANCRYHRKVNRSRNGSARKIQARQTPESFRGRLLKDISVTQRGWTLDVLNIVRRLMEEKRQRAGALQDASRGSGVTGKRASVLDCPPSAVLLRRTGGGPPPLSDGPEFTTADVYAFERELEKLHPDIS
jgi:hypothetical protein